MQLHSFTLRTITPLEKGLSQSPPGGVDIANDVLDELRDVLRKLGTGVTQLFQLPATDITSSPPVDAESTSSWICLLQDASPASCSRAAHRLTRSIKSA